MQQEGRNLKGKKPNRERKKSNWEMNGNDKRIQNRNW